MNCPVCKTTELSPLELEAGLNSQHCAQCAGNWIAGAAYWKWLETHGPNLPEREADTDHLRPTDSTEPLSCPECRERMYKYLVGKGMDFRLDQCNGCKGIWLDRHEWETLKERNLHDDLNNMLTEFWQGHARREARRKRAEQLYISKFGFEDYSEIARVRHWINDHANKDELIAFLTVNDPLEI